MSGKHKKKDFLYKAAEKIFDKLMINDKSGKLLSVQVKENLERLYPFAGKEKLREYYIQKVRLGLLLCLSGTFLTFGLLLSELINPIVKENKIYRRDYGGAAQEIPVKVTVAEETEHELLLKVRERFYGEEQLKKLYKEAVRELEKTISGENESLEYVETDLTLVSELSGYPFQIEWESQNYSVLNAEGKLQEAKIPKEGITVGLNAVFTYEDFRAEHLFYIRVYAKMLTKEEEEAIKLLETAKRAEAESREEEIVILPASWEGKKLIWSSPGNKMWKVIPFLTACTAGILYFLKDEDLKKEAEKRKEQMRLEYPTLVSKLSIYLGAGMTVKTAWEKIVADYKKRTLPHRRSPIYEEMIITCQEIKSGISETAAYERFGKRCGMPLYRKFSSVLVQNLRKGSTRLGPLLKEESRLAFEERKNLAQKAGEEAGTKLLLPMIIMLCIVMLMILLPAFMTF